MRYAMSLRLALSLLMALFIASSCATKKEAVKEEPAPPERIEVTEEFRLPETPPEQTPPKEKPSYLQPVLIEPGDAGEERSILLNFDNADIHTIISTFGELLNINYILTPGISGKVTIQSYKKFPAKDLFQIFQSILELNGLTAVREGEFYKIVPIDTAKQQPTDVAKGAEVEHRLDPTFITQLVPLVNVKAGDVSNILKGFSPRGTDIIVYEPYNMLIITGLPRTITKFMKIIEALDVAETESEAVRTFVYHVENGEAKNLAEILKEIYKSEGTKAKTQAARTTTPAARTRTTARRTTTARPTTITTAGLAGDVGEITITAYEDINALIIKTTPRSYLAILEVLKSIDIPPKQVLIEVIIAEVGLNKDLEFGVEWLIRTGSGDTVGFTTGGSDNPPNIVTGQPAGFAAVVSGSASSAVFEYLVTALEGRTDIDIVATPVVLALDHKEAEIEIGNDVPVATQSTTSTEGVTTTAQIQYRTVGTLLNVTPHITEKGNVSMKLKIERSDVLDEGRTIGTGSFPEFTTRNATTTAVVADGSTLFVGGLIATRNTKGRTGIPYLSRIPFLGYLFGTFSSTSEKDELIIMVTPHVIHDVSDARRVTEEFKTRVKTIRRQLMEFQKYQEEDAPLAPLAPLPLAPLSDE
jgi:type II secretory pathway component GspD/PulD (secretin)